jgi:hypothetical protein
MQRTGFGRIGYRTCSGYAMRAPVALQLSSSRQRFIHSTDCSACSLCGEFVARFVGVDTTGLRSVLLSRIEIYLEKAEQ